MHLVKFKGECLYNLFNYGIMLCRSINMLRNKLRNKDKLKANKPNPLQKSNT